MNSTVLKHKHHCQQQQQNSSGDSCGISSHSNNNSNQNSIFILNDTATNNIYYSDLSENNVASSLSASASTAGSHSTASSSVWSSASSTMCLPAAHALQKLFSCSSSSLKLSQGYDGGIDSNHFKSKSEILKKKSKFWKYLENEDNDKNYPKGVGSAEENDNTLLAKGFKFKLSRGGGSKSYERDSCNQEDLSQLLEYSCSLCDNCRCVDCQIGYFDCANSDDSDSEYSFHLSGYEEDDELYNSDIEDALESRMELKSSSDSHHLLQTADFELPADCCTECCPATQQSCTDGECCQQCCISELDHADRDDTNQPIFITSKDH